MSGTAGLTVRFFYSYYSAGTSGTFDNQRVHALRGSSTSIWDSSWSFAGVFIPPIPVTCYTV